MATNTHSQQGTPGVQRARPKATSIAGRGGGGSGGKVPWKMKGLLEQPSFPLSPRSRPQREQGPRKRRRGASNGEMGETGKEGPGEQEQGSGEQQDEEEEQQQQHEEEEEVVEEGPTVDNRGRQVLEKGKGGQEAKAGAVRWKQQNKKQPQDQKQLLHQRQRKSQLQAPPLPARVQPTAPAGAGAGSNRGGGRGGDGGVSGGDGGVSEPVAPRITPKRAAAPVNLQEPPLKARRASKGHEERPGHPAGGRGRGRGPRDVGGSPGGEASGSAAAAGAAGTPGRSYQHWTPQGVRWVYAGTRTGAGAGADAEAAAGAEAAGAEAEQQGRPPRPPGKKAVVWVEPPGVWVPRSMRDFPWNEFGGLYKRTPKIRPLQAFYAGDNIRGSRH